MKRQELQQLLTAYRASGSDVRTDLRSSTAKLQAEYNRLRALELAENTLNNPEFYDRLCSSPTLPEPETDIFLAALNHEEVRGTDVVPTPSASDLYADLAVTSLCTF